MEGTILFTGEMDRGSMSKRGGVYEGGTKGVSTVLLG